MTALTSGRGESAPLTKCVQSVVGGITLQECARRKGRTQKLPAVKDIQEGAYAPGGKEDAQYVMKISIPSIPVTFMPFLKVQYWMYNLNLVKQFMWNPAQINTE